MTCYGCVMSQTRPYDILLRPLSGERHAIFYLGGRHFRIRMSIVFQIVAYSDFSCLFCWKHPLPKLDNAGVLFCVEISCSRLRLSLPWSNCRLRLSSPLNFSEIHYQLAVCFQVNCHQDQTRKCH